MLDRSAPSRPPDRAELSSAGIIVVSGPYLHAETVIEPSEFALAVPSPFVPGRPVSLLLGRGVPVTADRALQRRLPMIVGSVHVAQRSMHGRRSPEQIEMHGTRAS